MRHFAFALAFLAILMICPTGTLFGQPKQKRAASGRLSKRTLTVGGVERTYWVAPVVDASPSPPVIVVLHANTGNGEMAAHNGRVHQTGPGRRSFVAYPNALGQVWDLKGPADVAFILAMIDDITRSDASLDRSRVLATGAGLGGALAQRLACESSDRFAAIALISSGFPRQLTESCKPELATPVLLIDGGIRRSGDVNLLSATETFEYWRKKNGCSGEAAVERRTTPRDHTITLARPCRDGAEVRYIKATDDGKPWMEEAAREIAEFILRFRRLPKF